jgi:hypothetical protein
MVANSVDQNVAEEEKRRKGQEANFPGAPQQLEKDPDWEEVTHPEQRKVGHREFKNTKTGERIRFDKGNPIEAGHEAKDHYHKYNPDSSKRKEYYLDSEGKPCPKYSPDPDCYPKLALKVCSLVPVA